MVPVLVHFYATRKSAGPSAEPDSELQACVGWLAAWRGERPCVSLHRRVASGSARRQHAPHAMSEGRKRRAAAAAASVALTSTKPSDVPAALRKFQPAKPAKPKKKRGAGGGGAGSGGAGRAASPGARKKARTAAPKPSRGATKTCARPFLFGISLLMFASPPPFLRPRLGSAAGGTRWCSCSRRTAPRSQQYRAARTGICAARPAQGCTALPRSTTNQQHARPSVAAPERARASQRASVTCRLFRDAVELAWLMNCRPPPGSDLATKTGPSETHLGFVALARGVHNRHVR